MSDLNDNNIQNQTPENSGSQLNDNIESAGNTYEPAMDGPEIISGVEPAKKSITAILVTIIVIIAVLAGGSAAAYNFIPWVKNNVKMLINDPEEYYAWVENENMEKTAGKIAEIYSELVNSDEQDAQAQLKANLNSEAVMSLIGEDTEFVIPEEIALDVQSAEMDGYNAGTLKLSADGTSLVTGNVYLKDGKYYYQIPELSSSYIAIDASTLFEDAFSELSYSTSPIVNELISGEEIQSILTDEELEQLLIKYFDIAFSNIDDVKLEKGVKCEVNRVKTEYNQLTAEIDEGCLYQIAKDILREAENDDVIIKIVESTGIMTKDEYQTAVKEILDQMGEYNISGGETIGTMNVYVDSSGIIQGRSFETSQDLYQTFGINYMAVNDGSDDAFEFVVTVDEESVSLNGSFEEKSGKKTGDIVFTLNNYDEEYNVNLHLNDFKVENEDKGYVSGEMTLDLSAFEMGELNVTLESDGKSQNISTELNINGTNYGTISLYYSDQKPDSITPFNDSEVVYNYADDGAEMEEYVNSADIEGFLNNFTTVFGIDFNSLMGGGYTDPVIDDDLTGGMDIPESAYYDFNKIKFQVNGKDVTFPAKIDGILDKVTVTDDVIEPGYNGFYYSEDGSLAVYVENTSSADAAPEECVITGLSVSDESDVELTVDGIGIGSPISEVVEKYGCILDDENSGYTYIENSDDENLSQITVFYYDGLIYEIDVDFY